MAKKIKPDDRVRYLERDIFPSTGKMRKDSPYGLQGDRVTIIVDEGNVLIVERARSVRLPILDTDPPKPFRFPVGPLNLSVCRVDISEARKMFIEKMAKPVVYKKPTRRK